jgi:UDP-2,4-diacetamido-2,4,6-trideoxy-beta-L-altropyranose hydrolase/UDP-4-amino-4,6-dideoxy-N-acetyl-beta-L-altrosamine N-acetyltransferase
MHILFRVDASLEIGSGHVMRCLTLAQALRNIGAQCEFVCRMHKGNLIAQIVHQGFVTYALPEGVMETWLGVSWQEDAEQTRRMIGMKHYDWLIVDHYELDAHWEHALRDVATQFMAIDDLANRKHDVDLVWDQNLGRKASDYSPWVEPKCEVHVGAMRALLRPTFFGLRAASRQRNQRQGIQKLLVTMGGVDKPNVTAKVLKALMEMPSALPSNCKISVVMGEHAPALNDVKEIASAMPWPTEVCVNVSDMASRMVQADLAIGALGSTAWERCCLGLPTLGVVLADNQKVSALHLEKSGAVMMLPNDANMVEVLRSKLMQIQQPNVLRLAQEACYRVTDGRGVARLLQRLRVLPSSVENAHIRRMQSNDLQMVLKWRNHPQVKEFMLTTHDISPQEHSAWFDRASQDEARALLIYEYLGEPMGFVQFSGLFDAQGATWGFYLSPKASKGTGGVMGTSALHYGFTQLGVDKILGEVMLENEASKRFHERLGFLQTNAGELNTPMLLFELTFESWFKKYNPKIRGDS